MTPICELYNGVTTHAWLCATHQATRKAAGWTVRVTGKFAAWPCDDCPDSLTALAFAPTRPESRLPSVSECPRGDMPETWVARLERLRGGTQ